MREIKKLINRYKALPNRVSKSNDPAKALAQAMRNDLDLQIVELPALDFAEGGANDSGYSKTKVGRQTATLSWVGDGVEYLEFGTGIEGVNMPYPNPSLMREHVYEPQAHGHIHDMYWILPMDYVGRDGEPVETCGWKPYKPMYNIRKNVLLGVYNPVIEHSVHDLVERWL